MLRLTPEREIHEPRPTSDVRTEILISDLERVLCEPDQDSVEAKACCDAVRQLTETAITVASIRTDALRRIYRIRSLQTGDDRPRDVRQTIDRVLIDLEAYEGDVVKMVVFPRGKSVYSVLLDQDQSRLLTCLVLEDRRYLPTVVGQLG